MIQNLHADVGPYALGVLDDADTERFEAHLADCDMCAAELESLLPVVGLMSEVDAEALLAAESLRSESRMMHRMISTVGRERRRARSRRMFGLAAGVVALAVFSSAALYTGTQIGATRIEAGGSPSPTVSAERLPGGVEGGEGGPNAADGWKQVSDPHSGVRAWAKLQTEKYGTVVSLSISNVLGPLTCRLVAVRASGDTEVLSTWNVPPAGYGTTVQPNPLTLEAVTAIPQNDISFVQVQQISEGGITQTLVTIPG